VATPVTVTGTTDVVGRTWRRYWPPRACWTFFGTLMTIRLLVVLKVHTRDIKTGITSVEESRELTTNWERIGSVDAISTLIEDGRTERLAAEG